MRELICYVNHTCCHIHESLVRRSIPALAHAGRVPGARMKQFTVNTVDAQGRSVQLAAGYDPSLSVYFLGLLDLNNDDADPLYESLYDHPAGRSTYGLTELAADIDRLVGRSVPVLLQAVQTSPTGEFVQYLGRH
jgi:hypothetical protein